MMLFSGGVAVKTTGAMTLDRVITIIVTEHMPSPKGYGQRNR